MVHYVSHLGFNNLRFRKTVSILNQIMVCLQNLTDVLLKKYDVLVHDQCTTKGIHDTNDF